MADADAAGPGAPTLMTAAARARAAARGVIDDPLAGPLLEAVETDLRRGMARGEGEPAQDESGVSADLLVAGTRYFDEFLAQAGRSGIRQVVLLASGLDTRPYRLWWPAGTVVYEVDQPQLLEAKTRALRALGAAPTGHRRAVGVDITENWPAALRQIGFDTTRPSAWVAEGLLLGGSAPEARDQLLDGVSALSSPGSQFAADLAGSDRPYPHNVDGRHDAAGYLQANGWATAPLGTEAVATSSPLSPVDARTPIRYLRATRR